MIYLCWTEDETQDEARPYALSRAQWAAEAHAEHAYNSAPGDYDDQIVIHVHYAGSTRSFNVSIDRSPVFLASELKPKGAP